MYVHFEELAAPQRAGGIESATRLLAQKLSFRGVRVVRSAEPRSDFQGEPDCLHFHGIWSPWLGLRLLRSMQKRVPCVITPHGMLTPWALSHKRTKKKLAWSIYQKSLLNRASLLHATSEAEASQFRQLGLLPPIAVIPWGIEIPSAPECLNAAHEFLPSNGVKMALFVGRIYPVKGLPMLVEAWAKVRPDGWRVRIVGPDEAGHRAEVERQIRDAGLAAEFHFTGALEGEVKEQEFRKADLLILPAHSENFGMVIGEALAHGLPVITTHGTPWKLLVTERCGWWTPVTAAALGQALQEAASLDAVILRQMGARGRAVAIEKFAWSSVVDQFIESYRWLLGQGPKPVFVR